MGDISPDAPIDIQEGRDFYAKLYINAGVLLFLASIILATLGLKKDKWFSMLTYAVHVTVVIVSLFF